ncbi:MAG TPA: tripartite tricarboxylate transporter substrate binding protein [Burkholderiales bacterium]|nr:tripartite tricarboxylate transporter substrate binding protein [Burkholderiales bacterium]
MSQGIKRGIALAFAAAALIAAAQANAQAWPSKTVRIVVPFGPGGGTDIQGRLLGKKFTESMGQTFVLENRAGAAGLIGAEIVAKSPPDGYNILFTTASLAVNVSLYKKSAIDPVKDLTPVSWISSVPLVLVVHPSVPAKNVKELVALTKKRAGKMNVASNGSGTTSHLSIEMLRQLAGVDVTHIPYKGGGPAITAMLTGEVDFTFATALAAQPHIKSGRVRPLAVTTGKRSSTFPDLPTMDSLYPGFESDNWYAMFLPAGTPREIVAKLNAEIVRALKSPDVRDFITKEGGDPVGSSPEELAKYFRREIEKYAKVIKAGNITAE